MRVLVTGISGFVGPHLARELEAHGHHVTGVGLHPLQGPHEAGLCHVYEPVDLLDPAATRDLIARRRPEAIYHLAGLAQVSVSWSDPLRYLTNNAGGAINLLEAVRTAELDPTILLVGTGEVYGSPAPEDIPTTETAPLLPASPYAVSKAAQDMIGYQYWRVYGLRVIRVRAFNHIGPGQSDAYVAAAFARQVAEIEAGRRDPVVDVGDLSPQRDFTDVRDMVRAYRLLVERGAPGEVYNAGSGVRRSVRSLLDALIAAARVRVEVRIEAARLRPVDAPVQCCDPTKLRTATGWGPAIQFEQTIADILDDWRSRVRAPAAAPGRRA